MRQLLVLRFNGRHYSALLHSEQGEGLPDLAAGMGRVDQEQLHFLADVSQSRSVSGPNDEPLVPTGNHFSEGQDSASCSGLEQLRIFLLSGYTIKYFRTHPVTPLNWSSKLSCPGRQGLLQVRLITDRREKILEKTRLGHFKRESGWS